MQKTISPSLKISSLGEPVVVPQKLKRSIATWANIEYQQYNFGHILTQTLLYKLFRIYILRFRMKQAAAFVQLYRRRAAICMFYCLNGSLQVMLPEIPTLSMQKDQFGFAYLPEGARLLQPVAGTELFIIELEARMLEELAASRKEFKELVDLATMNDPTARILPLLPMDHMIHHILEDMRQCKQSGGNLLMELKTANLQLINLYRKALNESENLKKLTTQSNLEIIEQVYREIRQLPNIPYTVSYFAQKYDIDQHILETNFQTVFKKRLHDFMKEACIKKT